MIERGPVVMGHELSGEVVRVGAGVTRFVPGDRVSCDSLLPCWDCPSCGVGATNRCDRYRIMVLSKDGGFARFACVPEHACFAVPDDVDLVHAALVEPLTVGVYACRRGRVAPGDRVVVLGAGPIGIACVQAARALGAREVLLIEPVEERRERARLFGAIPVDPADASGLDVSIDCAGHPESGPLAIRLLRPNGRAVIVAVFERPSTLQFNEILFGEKEVVGATGRVAARDFPICLAWMAEGRIDAGSMITSRIPLERIVEDGFAAIREHRGGELKIVVVPNRARRFPKSPPEARGNAHPTPRRRRHLPWSRRSVRS